MRCGSCQVTRIETEAGVRAEGQIERTVTGDPVVMAIPLA